MKNLEETKSPFKISTFLTDYDSFLLLRKSWDLVPKRFVLKSCLKTDLWTTHQYEDFLRLLESFRDIIYPSMKLQNGIFTSTEKATALSRENAAHMSGTEWIEEVNTYGAFNEHPPFIWGDEDEWQKYITAGIVADGRNFKSIE